MDGMDLPIDGLAGGGSRLPELRAPAMVVRDDNGVPYVFATNEHDLFFLQGWVHAEDRFFQMDVARRQAEGTLAELLGPEALADDVEARTIGLDRAAERSWPLLSADVQGALESYSAGVNAWLDVHPLPAEYEALELTGVPDWQPLDSLSVGKGLSFLLSFDLDDIERTQTLHAYVEAGQEAGFDGAALFSQDLFRAAPFTDAATLPDDVPAPQHIEVTEGAHPVPDAAGADQATCTAAVLDATPDAALVSNLGVASYVLAGVEDRARNCYLWGSMGVTTPVGLGLALATDDLAHQPAAQPGQADDPLDGHTVSGHPPDHPVGVLTA